MTDLETRLRATLAERAGHAPGAAPVADRVLAAIRTAPFPAARRRGWPGWTMPLLAAAAVAAVVAGVFLVVAQVRPSAPQPGGPPTRLANGTSTAASTQPVPSPTPTSPTVHSSATTGAPVVPLNPVGLTSFAATDLTFFGDSDAWAIGSANCIRGSGTCPAMVHTTDGGRSWHSMPQPPGNVTGIRFATPSIGYAFSTTHLEMTTDGGTSWSTQSGGAIALETLHNNVVRLVSPHSGCPGPCDLSVEYAALGSTHWTTASLDPAAVSAGSVVLVRSDSDVYVLTTRNWAGGAADATSTLYVSTDDGASWTHRAEPCPQQGGEVDSHTIAASPGGVVTALCVPRANSQTSFVAKSTDTGAHFAATGGTVPTANVTSLAGDPSTVLVVGGLSNYLSPDGGRSWNRITAVTGTASFVGFESPTLGRIVTDGGRTVWTTRDGGVNWVPFRFP